MKKQFYLGGGGRENCNACVTVRPWEEEKKCLSIYHHFICLDIPFFFLLFYGRTSHHCLPEEQTICTCVNKGNEIFMVKNTNSTQLFSKMRVFVFINDKQKSQKDKQNLVQYQPKALLGNYL